MALVSPNIALVVFGVILIVSAIVAFIYKNYENYNVTWFHTFIAVLTGLGVFVTFMFYYNVVALQNQQQQLAALDELARINDSILNSVLNEMNNASNIIPNFVLSMTPLSNIACCTGCNIVTPEDPVTPATCTEKMTLSYRIFSMWQDVILSNGFINYDPISYVSNFLQRANSPQLYEQWLSSYLNFTSKTQQFGNLLFKYALPIKVQTPQNYVDVATTLIADPEYNSIFN